MSEIEKAVVPVPSSSPVDWLLQDWVNQINRLGLRSSITLHLNGTIVSGTAISGKLFFEKYTTMMVEAFAAGGSSVPAKDVEEHFKRYAEIYEKPRPEDAPLAPPQYIHLEDAKFWNAAGHHIPSSGVLWRGRLSEVSGYNIGSLGAS